MAFDNKYDQQAVGEMPPASCLWNKTNSAGAVGDSPVTREEFEERLARAIVPWEPPKTPDFEIRSAAIAFALQQGKKGIDAISEAERIYAFLKGDAQ